MTVLLYTGQGKICCHEDCGLEELNHSCYSPYVASSDYSCLKTRGNTCKNISFQATVNLKVLFHSGLRSNKDFCLSGISSHSPEFNLMLGLELVQFQVKALKTHDMNILPRLLSAAGTIA
jgi:hypothetical protein